MGKSKIAKNTIASLVLQICSVLCGFIVPKLILSHYGSDVNGLVNSITQFLSFISLLDLGVGAVIISALYRPLAENDNTRLNQIVTSSDKFFKMIGVALVVYVIALLCIYPFFVADDFDYIYTIALIGAMSISAFSQYYFGMTDRLLLTADQKGYVQYNAQTVTLILNTLACSVLIRLGGSIQIVKLVTSLIYLARPVFLRFYINRYYTLNRKEHYSEEPIKQKWNGIAQHVSAVVLNDTDTVVLTFFSTLSSVSIYSVYNLVVSGLKKLFESSTNGIEAALGELWAKKEYEKCQSLFLYSEWIIHTAVTFVFSCAAILIVPFVKVYTYGITDAEYSQPIFALTIVLAYTVHCYRLPYHIMVKAAGHYKETQKCYYISAFMNLLISIIAVRNWGLIGVAIGTLSSMLYQTIWMAIYNSKYLIKDSFSYFIKQIIVDIILFFSCYFILPTFIKMNQVGYVSWILMSIKTVCAVTVLFIGVNSIFYRKFAKKLISKMWKRG